MEDHTSGEATGRLRRIVRLAPRDPELRLALAERGGRAVVEREIDVGLGEAPQ